jgi:repressor LexA
MLFWVWKTWSVPDIRQFTLKRFGRERGRIVLRPENKTYPVIHPKGNAEIFGVVVGQFRKY